MMTCVGGHTELETALPLEGTLYLGYALPLDRGQERRAFDRLVEGFGRVRQLERAAHAHRRHVDRLGGDVDAVGAAEGVGEVEHDLVRLELELALGLGLE